MNFTYLKIGKALFIGGRFNVTNVGSEASDSNISFSLPEGLTCYDVVGSSGSVSVNSSTIDTSMLSVRQSKNCFYIQKGAGGMGSIAALGTGYVMINAMIMLA